MPVWWGVGTRLLCAEASCKPWSKGVGIGVTGYRLVTEAPGNHSSCVLQPGATAVGAGLAVQQTRCAAQGIMSLD
jgi:hypothetical protein